MTTEGRAPRKDALRNRELLLAAAREVFAERGFSATLDDIARHAGVGVGTAYRHFPNKQAVAAEVLADATTHIVDDARDALRIEDPWQGLVAFLERTAARHAHDRALFETLTGQGDPEMQGAIWPDVVGAVSELFDRAQRAGVVRADAAPQDIAVILTLLGTAYDMRDPAGSDLWRRYLGLMLDGLRAVDRPPLQRPAPPVDSLRELIHAGKQAR